MLLLKYLLLISAAGLIAGAAAIIYLDIQAARDRRRTEPEQRPPWPAHFRWQLASKLALGAWIALFFGLMIAVVPSGMAGVRVSQVSGVLPGALYPGVHAVIPFVQHVDLYDIRDRVYMTAAVEDAKKKADALRVQTKEGLPVGLAVAVRYRLDPKQLHVISANLPEPIEDELVMPVVASTFRQIVPNYMVRDVFANQREEVRQRAAEAIAKRLAGDGIVVKEVMLRDVVLPPEYARSLESLLLREQESDRLTIEMDIKQKQVRTAELEAEADKARRIKQAEAEAQVVVLQAKAQADAMQHTLPLKEKQIQQTRLESEARKEATLKNAEALAQAKVIDSKAELEKRNLMSEADANRVRLMAAADSERMKSEAQVLKQNPLLIQKIIAERLSDKVQIMMVPSDGKFFFANDVLRSSPMAAAARAAETEEK